METTRRASLTCTEAIAAARATAEEQGYTGRDMQALEMYLCDRLSAQDLPMHVRPTAYRLLRLMYEPAC